MRRRVICTAKGTDQTFQYFTTKMKQRSKHLREEDFFFFFENREEDNNLKENDSNMTTVYSDKPNLWKRI
jgi:hypothetical protein